MQKLLTRTKYNIEYTSRRLAQRKAKEENLRRTRDRLNNKVVRDEIRQQTKANRQARWDRIYRGKLAPRQDVGEQAEKYGTLIPQLIQPRYVHEKLRQTCPFVRGDRVVLVGTRYRDSGRIGKVERLDEDGQCVYVEGVEMGVIFQPKFMRSMIKTESPTHTSSLPIPFTDVRLVYPLENPLTGRLRDVIINEITLRKPTNAERKAGLDKPIRSIAGVEPAVELPYPETKEAEHTDSDSDTLRIQVEERTWVPTLGIPPMPESILDELRGRYSRYRTRFDDAFIAKKEAAHQHKEDKKRALKMAARTPLNEIQSARREEFRKINAAAREGGAWKPLSPRVVEGMARLALGSGRGLPILTREQFKRIAQGFEDDVVDEDEGDEGEGVEAGWEDVETEGEEVETEMLGEEIEGDKGDGVVPQDKANP